MTNDTYSKLLSLPVQSPINRAALDRVVYTQFNTTPKEEIQRAYRAQQIERHNDDVDARRAKKQELRRLAKQAGISTTALKRMIGVKK